MAGVGPLLTYAPTSRDSSPPANCSTSPVVTIASPPSIATRGASTSGPDTGASLRKAKDWLPCVTSYTSVHTLWWLQTTLQPFSPFITQEAAGTRNAAAVIVAHNHPSGIAEPSQADEFITQRVEALAPVDIRLLDHLIIGDGACVSPAESGLL